MGSSLCKVSILSDTCKGILEKVWKMHQLFEEAEAADGGEHTLDVAP